MKRLESEATRQARLIGETAGSFQSYVRVIALQRSGDRAAMKQAALEYLHRYPEGFR
jgi:hypothetical protein